MTQISRPFQIALAAMVLLAAVWFVALRGHSSGSESSGSAASSSAPPVAPQQPSASGSSSSSGGSSAPSGSSSSPSSTYHGSAPGVAGLSRAIAKAHGAAAQSEQNARRLAQKSAQASGSGGSTQSSSPSAPNATAKAGSPGTTHSKVTPTGAGRTHAAAPGAKAPATTAPSARTHAKSSAPAMQLNVERQLKQGKVVAILFWNSKGAVDAVVRRELQAAGRTSAGKLAVHVASSGQVGDFGTFTRAVQVYSTPTVLLVNSKGVASTVTGLTDAFSIAQAVKEVKLAR
ncbi:MAG TPA: hypothetical protein VGO29_05075 [Solirubrobacteraceae bacterium]|jgi:hypothetical protein|nr:hypothetical protein [Solirubrobacteraceae bacterium]